MFIFLPRGAIRVSAGPWLRRITAALAAVGGGALAWAAAVPAASAATIPVPDPGGAYGPVPAPPGGAIQVITAGGMPGWQVTLIAVAAAILAAAAAVRLDRALTAGRAAFLIAAWRSLLAPAQHRPGARRPVQRPGADPADRAASAHDTSLRPAAPTSGTPDIVEFGGNLTR